MRRSGVSAAQAPDLATWLSKNEAADFLGVSIKTIERLASEREIEVRYRHVEGRRPEPVYNPADMDREKEKRTPAFFRMPPERPEKNSHAKSDASETKTLAVPRLKLNPLALLHQLANVALAHAAPEVPLDKKLWLTLNEAEQYAGLSRRYLMRKITAGEIGYMRDGRGHGYKLRRTDLEAL